MSSAANSVAPGSLSIDPGVTGASCGVRGLLPTEGYLCSPTCTGGSGLGAGENTAVVDAADGGADEVADAVAVDPGVEAAVVEVAVAVAAAAATAAAVSKLHCTPACKQREHDGLSKSQRRLN